MKRLLGEYKAYLEEKTQLHAGFPYNLNYDYNELLSFFKYTINNLGDPFVQSNYQIDSRYFEQETIKFFANLYQAENWWGYITSSGTEGNLYGILLGRETYPEGILYSSDDSHYSVRKAAHLFRISHVVVESQVNGEINYQDLHKKLQSDRPAIINLNLGTTLKGAVDNLDLILETLQAKGIKDFHIHCDGALGGMIVPYTQPHWVNFERPIHSVSISGHKFIGCPFPCGIVLTRNELVEKVTNKIDYIDSIDTTINGSRNGHAALFLWYAIEQRKHLFSQEVDDCVSKANYFYQKLKQGGVKYCLLNPNSCTVVFTKPDDKIVKKWQLAASENIAHVIVMQNHSHEILNEIVQDYFLKG